MFLLNLTRDLRLASLKLLGDSPSHSRPRPSDPVTIYPPNIRSKFLKLKFYCDLPTRPACLPRICFGDDTVPYLLRRAMGGRSDLADAVHALACGYCMVAGRNNFNNRGCRIFFGLWRGVPTKFVYKPLELLKSTNRWIVGAVFTFRGSLQRLTPRTGLIFFASSGPATLLKRLPSSLLQPADSQSPALCFFGGNLSFLRNAWPQ
ncbi:hypothetical protein B0H16DRAFT_1468881 [Mycena metata]|uniref:Uncharacterized protein n=1 Tax=Mycena metata TaxID=1033252 RepID=A0AAD7MT01_9AGAR|nr:hypothetical protein B0H16DRAFT_1468881 [Mycena metata]